MPSADNDMGLLSGISVKIPEGRRWGVGGTGGMLCRYIVLREVEGAELNQPTLPTDERWLSRWLEERRPALDARMLDFLTADTLLDRFEDGEMGWSLRWSKSLATASACFHASSLSAVRASTLD